MIYSHSRLNCFTGCPYKFKLQYIDKAETEEEEYIEAFLGLRVHETLEKLYKDLKFLKENSLQDLLAFFDKQWEKHWNNNIIIVRKGYASENYRKMGVKYITDYYNRYKPFNQDRTINTEKQIIIPLDKEGKFKMRGVIDRIAYKNGYYEVHDYKTSGSLPPEQEMIKDRQLALYSLAVLKSYQDAKKVRQVWHFLAFDKDIILEKSKKELEQIKKETIALIKEVENSKKNGKFPTKTSNLCDWCEYQPQCPEWKHLYKTEEKPANEYLKEDGVVLVNKWSEVKNKIDKLEEEESKLKEAVIAYAEKQGVNMLYGSNMKARVTIQEMLKFPGKNDEETEELIKLLKKMKKWEEVEALDVHELRKKVENEEWEPEQLKKLKKFETKEITKQTRLSKFNKEEEE